MKKNIIKKDVIKKLLIILILFLLSIVGFFLINSYNNDKHNYIESLSSSAELAKIDDTSISKETIDKILPPYLDYFKNIYSITEDDELKEYKNLLYNELTIALSEQEAFYKDAVKNNISIDDKLFNENYKKLENFISSNFDMTINEFMNKYNFTEKYLKDNFKKELIINEYVNKKLNINDEKIENYYNNNKEKFRVVRASHILISNSNEHPEGEHEHTDGDNIHSNLPEKEQKKIEDNKKANKEKALEVLNKAKSGEDFKTLSDKYSDDISAKEFGGDLNYFGKGEMVTEFENACFDDSFKINTIFKDIVETEFGYHIIKKTDDKIKPLNDVKNSIISEIYSEDFLKLEENTLKNHKIKYHSFITNFEY